VFERLRMSTERSITATWLRALIPPLVILAWLAVAVIAGWLLGHLTRTILLVVLSGVIAFALTPLANVFSRWLPRSVALALAYLLGVGVILGFGAFVVATAVSQVASLVAAMPEYAQQAQSLLPQAEDVVRRIGVPPDTLTALESQGIDAVRTAGMDVARESVARVAEVFGTVVDMVLVLILSVYLAANGPRLAQWLQRETPDRQRHRTRLAVAVINRVVGGYVRGTITLALLIGALVGVGLAILQVPYAVLLGVLAFFMEFIPVLGVFISGAASLVVALFHFHEPFRPLLVLLYFVFVHVIEGDVVGPRIMGRAVGIHPATGLIALMVGTELFGVWGALFAAPLAGLVQAILTAVWMELRGGAPEDVLQAVTAQAENEVAHGAGVPVPPPASRADSPPPSAPPAAREDISSGRPA
jgi:predicted PurR-regulated permease PerM